MASENDTNDQWPLQAFLQKYRRAAAPGKGMSVRQAARLAGISETRWRQVEAGRASVATNQFVPVMPKPETLFKMLRAVHAPVEEGMRLVGYDLANYPWLLEDEAAASTDGVDLSWFPRLPKDQREQVLTDLQRMHIEAEVEAAKRAS
ncbi:helix-turn-helix domain-containing protein [Nocardioides sp. R1-1]|uniref:helix-turn-helix domain-containing protein n=1 Tax=Nocardioides sp. R1-1 TaxID=3383502 RepID=UPI0038CF9FE7